MENIEWIKALIHILIKSTPLFIYTIKPDVIDTLRFYSVLCLDSSTFTVVLEIF